MRSMEHWDLRSLAVEPRHPQILQSAHGEGRAIALHLPAGEKLQDHEVHERAYLTVVDGEVEVDAGETVSAGPGSLLVFDPRERHEVRATTDARLLLVLAPWPGDGHPGSRDCIWTKGLHPRARSADEWVEMSVPPPSSSFAPPGVGGSSLREFAIKLESESGWKRRRAGEDVLRVSALGATLEHDRMLQEPLKLALGMLQIGIVEIGSADAKSRFPILRRLSATAIVPREHGVEGWLWTRGGGSALTSSATTTRRPNAALLFTKPLGDDHLRSFAPEALEEIAARSPLGSPAVYGLLLRVADTAGRGDLPPVRHPAPADRPRGRAHAAALAADGPLCRTPAWPSTRRPAPRRPSRRPAWAEPVRTLGLLAFLAGLLLMLRSAVPMDAGVDYFADASAGDRLARPG